MRCMRAGLKNNPQRPVKIICPQINTERHQLKGIEFVLICGFFLLNNVED